MTAPVTDPNAPFGPGALTAPLSDAQATAVAAYLSAVSSYIVTYTGTGANRVWHFGGNPIPKADENDSTIVSDYYAVQGGNAQGKINTQLSVPGVSTVEDFLSALSNGALWTRVGEFALGFLLLGVAAYAVVRSTTGIRAPSPLGPTKTLVNATRSRPSAAPAPRPVRTPKPVAPVYESRHAPSRIKPSGNYSSGKHSVDLSAPIL